MSNLQQWSAVVAFFVPIVVAVLTQTKWASWLKACVFMAVSLVAATGTAYFEGSLTGKRWFESALIIVPAAAAFYYGWWKPTVAPKIASLTDLNT